MRTFTPFFKPLVFLLAVSCMPLIVFSQIQGSVKDVNNVPLASANVLLLLQKDSSMVSGVLASEQGTFSISNFTPGAYLLGISMVGYKPAFSSPFILKSSNDHLHIDPIIVEVDTRQLQDVDVVAKKQVYELEIDRTVINVENSITSTGNTALEVLEKAPGVIVDRQNNSITMSGKSGVMIIINGKQNRMPISAAVEMLAAMNADNVKKIELITTPPAKYDAEGDAGIINIVLKKNDDFGTNGSFTLGAGMGVHEKLNGSLNLNHHVEKVNYFGLYNASFNNTQQQFNAHRIVDQNGSLLETNSESLREAQLLFQNARLGFDYTISSKTVLGMLASGYIRDWDMDAVNDIFYRRDNVITDRSNLKTIELNKWVHYMGNVNLQHHFKEDEILEINLDYLDYNLDNPSNYVISNTGSGENTGEDEGIDVTKSTPIHIAVGTIDYSKQLGSWLKVEGGLKATITRFFNDVAVSYLRQGTWQADDELTNNYRMKENISAAYATVNLTLDKKTSVIGGLRYEYLNSVLSSDTQYGILDLHYGKLFPTFYFSRKFNEHNTWQFSYSRRIDRPTFNELAPFIIFQTPETFISGNEKLMPAFSDILKTDYQHNGIMFSISYTDTKDAISRFQPKLEAEENKLYVTSKNLDHMKTTSAMLAFPVTLFKWWKMQNNFSWIYQTIETVYDEENIDINLSNYRANSIQNLTISKSITAEVSGFYQSASLFGIAELKPYGKLDIGLEKKFNDGNSRLSLNLTDVFKTNIYKSTANVPELNLNTRVLLDFETRVVRLTYTQNFGNTKAKAARTRGTASEEERGRISTQ
ncbi:MAG TPA: outer membrane beta-barrel family protein [Prolixibacteraceae bacterium]|nr:outer membrane beta-barrel family protein [Prolixibacteraceae bacterium]